MKNRYDQLIHLVLEVGPKSIAEVGVHGAIRSVAMCRAALGKSTYVTFTGYDVFETRGKEFHERALNGKGIPSRYAAEKRLRDLVMQVTVGALKWNFVIGNTKDTLHGKAVPYDFAFVDGDHRVNMIRGDAAALDCPCIVFDDYYTPGPDGKITDIEKYGANRVVEEYAAQGFKVEILPKQDITKEGCFASLAVVRR